MGAGTEMLGTEGAAAEGVELRLRVEGEDLRRLIS